MREYVCVVSSGFAYFRVSLATGVYRYMMCVDESRACMCVRVC